MANGGDGQTTGVSDREMILQEYGTLREETLKRVELRFQIFNLTLLVAGALFTVAAAEKGQPVVLLLYPVLTLFFAAAFTYESMMLVELGAYIREVLEVSHEIPLGWATHFKDRYRKIEPFELFSTFGLFLGTELMALVAYHRIGAPGQRGSGLLLGAAWVATGLTFLALLYPWLYHQNVLRRSRGKRAAPGA